jgi:hypothetical protein
VGASTSHNPKGLHGLYRDSFTFIIIIIIIIIINISVVRLSPLCTAVTTSLVYSTSPWW